MEEEERNARLQEIQQRTQPDNQENPSPHSPSEIVSKSVGPFCLRRTAVGPPNTEGCSYYEIVLLCKQFQEIFL